MIYTILLNDIYQFFNDKKMTFFQGFLYGFYKLI